MYSDGQELDRFNIVIVDDIPANLRLLAGILSRPDYMIRPITDPLIALKAIKADPPDIILLDIMMPVMSGYDVCENFKSDPSTRDIPIIFITAKDDLEDKVKGLSLGAVDYITKPFQADEVIVRVQMHLKMYGLQKSLQKKSQDMLTLNRQLEHENQERRKIEAELRESYLWLNSVFNALEEAVIIQDPDRLITDLNHAAEKMFGYTRDEVKGLSVECFHVDREHYLAFGKRIAEAFDVGQTLFFEFKAKKRDGEVFPTEHSVAILRNSGQQAVGIVSVVRDLTEKKEAEEKLRENEKLQTVFEITGAVCHELNQPLMAISGYSELALMDLLPLHPAHIKLKKIQKQIERMAEITKRLMHISRYKTKDYPDCKIVDLVRASESS